MWTTWAAMFSLFSVNAACTGEPVRTQREHRLERSRDVEAGDEPVTAPRVDSHLAPKDRIGDVLRHPACQGHARLLLPWDDRSYDEGMRLSEIRSLLPYHSHVEPRVVVDGMNRIIDDVSSGRQVFYAFYTEEEQRRDPTRLHAGLFFFRGKPRAPFAVVSPGGGFAYVGSVHEGFPYAAAISDAGYNAFVLKYRAGLGGSTATEDLAAALSFIVRSADTLSVDRRSYSLWGSSAGARMAAAIGSHGTARFGGDDVAKPAAVILAYTGHSDSAKASRRLSSLSAKRTASHLRRSWRSGWRCCAQQGHRSSFVDIRTWATASGPASARARTGGSERPSASGRTSSQRSGSDGENVASSSPVSTVARGEL